MKLTQFRTRASNQQRLGVAVGDVVCDVAELARALEAAGAAPASWLLDTKDIVDVIGRGQSALGEISALLTGGQTRHTGGDRKSTRLNSSHANISYAVFCLKKKNNTRNILHVCDNTRQVCIRNTQS